MQLRNHLLKLLPICFILLSVLFVGCESNESRINRIEQELSTKISEVNTSRIFESDIIDTLNIFRPTWELDWGGRLLTQDKKTGFSGPSLIVNMIGKDRLYYNGLNIFGNKNGNSSYPYNITKLQAQELDEYNRSWNFFTYGEVMITSYNAGNIKLDYDLSNETGLNEVNAIWGYYATYDSVLQTIKESNVNSGEEFFEKYLEKKGGDSKSRNFCLFATQSKNGQTFRLNAYFFEPDTKDLTNRVIRNSAEINKLQYDFFNKAYNSLIE